MKPQRSCVSALVLVICVTWAALAWLLPLSPAAAILPSLLWHKIISVVLATALSIRLFLAVSFEQPQ
jgi:hypothetical protein